MFKKIKEFLKSVFTTNKDEFQYREPDAELKANSKGSKVVDKDPATDLFTAISKLRKHVKSFGVEGNVINVYVEKTHNDVPKNSDGFVKGYKAKYIDDEKGPRLVPLKSTVEDYDYFVNIYID